MSNPRLDSAYYARSGSRYADWRTVLHPPYTIWHLSYVVLGAAVAPHLDVGALILTLTAFFLALGVAAHALDEKQGRPLGTRIPDTTLTYTAAVSLIAAIAVGLYGVFWWAPVNVAALVTIPVGATLVVGYNLELFGGRLHNDLTFALAWGGFPVVVGYLAQSPPYHADGIAAAAAATLVGIGTAHAQRLLSTPARHLRRRVRVVTGTATANDGTQIELDHRYLLTPLEGTLRVLSWTMPAIALMALLIR